MAIRRKVILLEHQASVFKVLTGLKVAFAIY